MEEKFECRVKGTLRAQSSFTGNGKRLPGLIRCLAHVEFHPCFACNPRGSWWEPHQPKLPSDSSVCLGLVEGTALASGVKFSSLSEGWWT